MEEEKHAGGRPAKWEDPLEFEKKAEEYFTWIEGDFTIEEIKPEDGGKPFDQKIYTRYPEPPTLTGLCLFMGFESRQSFHDYAEKAEFSYACKKARMKVENNYEKNLITAKNPTGSIFALKNLGWKDKQEVEQSGSIKVETITGMEIK